MKLHLIGKLLAPIGYLRIKHEEKAWVDFYFPFMMAVLVTALFYFLPKPVAIVGKEGLVAQVNGLLQVLTGFYIAALAAVSTFQSEGMDKLMDGDPPTIVEKRKGRKKDIPLTRRRFLCYLFGYLALVCFVIFAIGLFVNLVVSVFDLSELLGSVFNLVRTASLFVYLFILSNMMIVTLLGLYYLTVRIHVNKE